MISKTQLNSYFGARYYLSDISVWASVDPLAEKRSWLSPYNYCQLNPIILTDPTGMLDDGYTIDENGNTERVDNTGGKEYDVIYNKKDYYSGKKDYDRSGTKNGIQIDRGQFSNFRSLNIPIEDDGGYQIGEVTRSSCEIKSKEVADNLLIFMDRNTVVEWSNQNLTDPDGRNFNVFTTSREGGEFASVSGINSLTRNYMDNGNMLIQDDHNHPFDNPRGSKISGTEKTGDKGFKKEMQNYLNPKGQKLGEKATFRMLYRGKFTDY